MAALAARDKTRLQALFADECYWRDFLAFTWTIVTLEGRERIWDMLLERLGEVKPENWQIEQTDEPANHRGLVHLRDRGRARQGPCAAEGRARLLDILHRAARIERLRGAARADAHAGTDARRVKDRANWLDGRNDETAELGVTRQPYCLIVGGGQGGIGAGGAAEAARRADADRRRA